MSVENTSERPWLKTYQIAWEGDITNEDLPPWARVFAVAMARTEPNLHTCLQPGELAKMIGTHDGNGVYHPADRRNIGKYIRQAVALGKLDPTSTTRCLVLPSETVGCGRSGWRKPCAVHSGQSSRPKRAITLKRPVPEAFELEHRVTPGSRDIFGVSVPSERNRHAMTPDPAVDLSPVNLDTIPVPLGV